MHRAWAVVGLTAEIATAELAADLAVEPAAGLIERLNSVELAVILSSAKLTVMNSVKLATDFAVAKLAVKW